MKITSNRSGRIIKTLKGYEAFIPNPLPPVPIDQEMYYLLSAADRKLGRLEGITLSLKDQYSKALNEVSSNNSNYQNLLDMLFKTPIITRKEIMKTLSISSPTAGELLDTFCRMGILEDATPDRQRNKQYYFNEYLDILEKGMD